MCGRDTMTKNPGVWLQNNGRPFVLVTLWLDKRRGLRQTFFARACGVRTYEPRQGRKAATAVCFAIAAVTLAPLSIQMINAKLKNRHAFGRHFAFLIFNF